MIPQSTRTGTLARIVFATFLSVPAFAAGPVSLLQLSQTGGSLIEGDKKFSTFSMSGLTNVINPADILVETVALPGGFLGLCFSGIMSPPGADVDFAIFYTAETISGLPLISEIGQSFVLGGGGAGGFVIIGETVFDQGFFMGNAVAQSSIGFDDSMDPAGELIQGDQLIINPPRNKVWVDKDIHLIPLNTNSSVSLSKLVQVFCQNQILVTCPTNKTVGCGPWNFDLPTAINACCSSNLTITAVSTVTNQVSPCTFCATRTWAISDACGNTTTTNCAQTVCFTRDITPPVITCPTNLNLGCNPPTIPACSLTQVSVTDDCGPVNLFCNLLDTTNGCVRLRTIVYTAIDQCSNLASCTQLITWIRDTNPPVFTLCPTNLDLGCNPATIPGCNLGLVAAQDDCGPVGITCASVDTTNGCTRLRTITYTAIDICTNRNFCTQLITWKVDTTPPVLIGVPTNRNFQCFADYLALPPAVVTPVDNCDGTNVILRAISSIVGTCPIIIQTCWTAIDQCNNSNTACVVYTIRDTTPPIITCPTNLTFGCNSNIPPCPMNIAGFRAIGGIAGDNCDTNLDYFCFDGPLIGNQIVRTHTVCDDCTNCASCTQIITFVGANAPPTIYCPPDRTVECTNDVPPCLATLAGFLAAGGWVSTTNLLNFTCVTGPFIGSHCDGSVIRTYTITDRCSNTVSCQQRILVRDTTPPNIHCGPNKEVQCGTDWFFDIPTASDNCDGPNRPVVLVSTVTNIAVPRCPGIFSVTRTWRATDSCSNNAFCNQTVTIVDTEPPNITCEQDKEELCGIAWAFDIPTAVDKCDLNNVLIVVVSTVTNVSIPRCPAIFSVTRTWRATDTCGNSSFCNQTVTIVDIEPPNITCEQDKEVQCGTDWAFDIPTAVDKCDLNNVLIEVVATVTNTAVPRCPRIFSVTRTWRAIDTCGNTAFCNQTVTIVDTEPPNLTCGADKEVQCGTDWAFDIPTAVDKCDLNNVLIEVVATVTNTAVPRCPKILSVTRTWRTTDTCGNAAFCNQTVTIVDTEPPNLTCGADKQAQCGTDWTFDIPTAVDKCDLNNVLIEVAVTVTNVATPRCPKVFSVTRIWRATDTCGNSSFCNQTVTIVDTTPPNLTCAHDQIVECGTSFAFTRPTAVDACDGTNVVIEITSTVTNVASPRCPGLFTVRRTWRAYDTCINETFCSQTISVVDTTPPNLTCPANQIVECGNPIVFTPPFAADACDGTNVVIRLLGTVTTAASPRCPGLTNVTRTWSATDTCGNSNLCNQTITLVDTTPPELVCANNSVVECGLPWNFTPPFAVDICDGTNVTIAIVNTVTNPLCGRTFSALRTWRASDSCSNSVLCSQSILVVDTTPPNLSCARNQTVECGDPFAFTPPTANDICDDTNVTITILSTTTNALCGATFVAIRTWQATDRCGNRSQCSQAIRVVDTEPPVLAVVPGNQFFYCFGDVPPPPPVTAFDVCDTNVTVTFSAMTNGRCPFIITRCWTAVDDCGNSVQACQSITVSPPPPVVVGPTNQTVCPGNPATFCAVISSACPATRQWYRDGVAIPGATNVCHTIPNVTIADAGQYCIAVTGSCQSVTNCARLEVCMAALGDFVWNDLDHDGIQDFGESGVQDVMVQLFDCLDHPVQTRFTDEFGGYLFTGLTAGTYRVTFVLPADYKFTIPNVGNDALDSDANTVTGQTGCYTLAAGETNRTVDAGIFQPAALGDFVWLDSNTNGVQDGMELGVSNVLVKLMDCSGNVLATTNTDANGFYLFTDLAPGNYNVMFNPPAGYGFTGQDQGGDDALDSDANPATGMTACYTLASGQTNLTVDAGLFVLNLPCVPATFDLTGDSDESGTAGNIRSFSAGGVTVRASAFSRTTGGTWATAWLGSYDEGLGVTDGSEGDGSDDRHVVDNLGRFNYVLFEFSQSVVVNRAYLDHVIDDSDITVWIGNFPDPFNNHLTLSDALLASFALTEENSTSDDGSRWAPFNGAQVSGNTLVIAAKTSGSANDEFKISKVDICRPPLPCAPALRLTTTCVSASALGQPITFNGTVSNGGNTTVTNITVTHSIAGVVLTIPALAAGKTTNYSGSFTPTNCGSFAATITAAGDPACNGSHVSATVFSTCFVPCPPPACPPATFDLTGDSSDSGTAGNIRTFSAGGVTVRVSGFSRTTSGTWATAWLGSYDEGLGVTDGSEGDGSNDRHVVDNVGRFNYVLFEFNQSVVVNRAYLDHVISDSDITVWIGDFPDPFNNHLTLSDALLASFALTEGSPASNDNSRWALFNGGEVSGNTLVIAAETGGTLNDQFKISKLDICGPPRSYPLFIRPLGEACLLEWPAEISSGCVLESTTSLMPPVTWSVVSTNPPNPYMITNSPQTRTRFYRIRMQ